MIIKNLKTIRAGWDKRPKPVTRYGIVVHTTNGRKGSTFSQEISFLRNSPNVTAHFIISKYGDVVQLLEVVHRAWHVGAVNDPQYGNSRSIGIELHYTPGEDKKLPFMYDALRSLCRDLMKDYPIADIKMHREVAIPKGRKIDPSCFTDAEFAEWKEITRFERKYVRVKEGSKLWTSPDYDHPLATHITTSDIREGVFIKAATVSVARVDPDWYWIPTGIGFIHRSAIE